MVSILSIRCSGVVRGQPWQPDLPGGQDVTSLVSDQYQSGYRAKYSRAKRGRVLLCVSECNSILGLLFRIKLKTEGPSVNRTKPDGSILMVHQLHHDAFSETGHCFAM